MGHVSPLNNIIYSSRRSCTISITADSIYFHVQERHSVSIKKTIKPFSDQEPPTPLEELTALLQIRLSTGIECDTPFPFSFLSTPSAFWSWPDIRTRIRGQSYGVSSTEVSSGSRDVSCGEDLWVCLTTFTAMRKLRFITMLDWYSLCDSTVITLCG